MIKTKSIFEKKSMSDGARICVMRWVKTSYDYDKWQKALAPSAKLLNDYRDKKINWNEYEIRYLKEMENQKELIKELKERSDKWKD